jgi:hypothetical protein
LGQVRFSIWGDFRFRRKMEEIPKNDCESKERHDWLSRNKQISRRHLKRDGGTFYVFPSFSKYIEEAKKSIMMTN